LRAGCAGLHTYRMLHHCRRVEAGARSLPPGHIDPSTARYLHHGCT
jgi:hypothetical protein